MAALATPASEFTSKEGFAADVTSVHTKTDALSDKSVILDDKDNHDVTNNEKADQVLAVDEEVKPADTDDNKVYPGSFALVLITIALCLAVFCVSLDNTIIATAIPKISNQFHALDDIGWYGSAYLLTGCAFQLFFGKLYTFFSVKWVFLTAFGIFELGSLICGVAPNSIALIIGRAVAGVGSAGTFSGAILIIAHSVPLNKRSLYTAMIAGMYGLASVAGPLLGGVFSDRATWRWCFYVNLPIGLITFIFLIFFFKSPEQTHESATLPWKEKLKLLDFEGMAVFFPGIICILLALQWGGTKYAWGSGRIIALLVLFVVLIAVFIVIQIKKGDRGTVPPRIFTQRTVLGSTIFGACFGGAFFTLVYFLPLWFQAVKGVSAEKSGIMSLPSIVSVTLFGILAAGATQAEGHYSPWVILSSVLMAIGAGLLSTLKPDSPHQMWLGYQFLFGIGAGFGFQVPIIAVQTVLDMKDVPTGTVIVGFGQTLFGALAVSIGQDVLTNQLVTNLKSQLPNMDPSVVTAAGATAFRTFVSAEDLPKVLTAYNISLTNVFYVPVGLACLSLIGALTIEWRSVKGKKVEMGGVA